MSNRVVHFEIPSDDPEANIKFFEEAFGWSFTRFGSEEYWLAKTGDDKEAGINGAVMRKVAPGQPMINSINVENLEEAIKKIEKAGGRIIKPKMPVPKIGWIAFFTDPDGNCHCILQKDNNAA